MILKIFLFVSFLFGFTSLLRAGDEVRKAARKDLVDMLGLNQNVEELELEKTYKYRIKMKIGPAEYRSLLIKTWNIYMEPSPTEMNANKMTEIRSYFDRYGLVDGLEKIVPPHIDGNAFVTMNETHLLFLASEFNQRIPNYLKSDPSVKDIRRVFDLLQHPEIGEKRFAKFFERTALTRYAIYNTTVARDALEVLTALFPCTEVEKPEFQEIAAGFVAKFQGPNRSLKDFYLELFHAEDTYNDVVLASLLLPPIDVQKKLALFAEMLLVLEPKDLRTKKVEFAIKYLLKENPAAAEEIRKRNAKWSFRVAQCDKVLFKYTTPVIPN